jgi:hypothetical protein
VTRITHKKTSKKAEMEKLRKKIELKLVILDQPKIFGVVFVLKSILGSKLACFRQA